MTYPTMEKENNMSKFKVGDYVRLKSFGGGQAQQVMKVQNPEKPYPTYTLGDGSFHLGSNLKFAHRNLDTEDPHSEIKSDGGPSSYYDFLPKWKTWNDFADYKSSKQWQEHSFHLGNVGKVLCRWGDKSGTTKSYDAKKIVYSGLRVLMMLEGSKTVREYLQRLLDDPQFKESDP
jgi:uncharacterized protein YodC (DUF2158 family)